jgi:3-oxoacyl-[acyl-carrier-protein] synthase II
MLRNPVAITGAGVVSPIGRDLDACFELLLRGESGLPQVAAQAPRPRSAVGGLALDFDGDACVGIKEARRTARFTQFAVQAARDARRMAELEPDACPAERIGTVIGTVFGGLDLAVRSVEDFNVGGTRRVSPYALPAFTNNMAAGYVAIDLGARGPSYGVGAAWASSAVAIARAASLVLRGAADVVFAGGADSLDGASASALLGECGEFTARHDQPNFAYRPFDRRAAGAAASEGAAILLLERLDHAEKRGAPVLATLAGVGATYASTRRSTPAERVSASARAVQVALESAGVGPEAVGMISAYGSGDLESDALEIEALQAVFGARAAEIQVSTSKPVSGHLLGAASAFEAAMAIWSLRRGEVPPISNLEAPAVNGFDYVRGERRASAARYALVNTFSANGHNVALLFAKAPVHS